MIGKNGRKWLLALLVILCALIGEALAEKNTHVVILGTSDMHGNIWGWSYQDGKETDNDGMARLYTYIQEVRKENPLTFLVDAGDEIQGTILTDDIASREPDQPHPVIAAMNRMGYDSMTLGNHEFDWGVTDLLSFLRTAEFPILSENIRDAEGNCLTGLGWTILERGGVRIAVIGVTTPGIPRLDGDKEGVDALTFEAASDAVKRAVREIGDRADILMVSAHMGLEAEYDEDGGSDSARKILEENPEIDVLQVGHLHITAAQKEGRVPVGGVRNAGREIARFDLTLDGDKQIIDSEISIIDMANYEPSEEIRGIPEVRLAHERATEFAEADSEKEDAGDRGALLGSTTARFQPDNEIRGIPEYKVRDTALVELILKIEMENAQADVAATALFRDDSDLKEGDIYSSDLLDIYPYENTLCRMTVTGEELRRYMEWSAGHYNQWTPGDINISFDPDFPGYQYDLFAGVDYEINLSKPKGERIENVMFRGKPLQDDDVLTLAVTSYRYSSVIKAENLAAGKREWESSCSIRDMIADYFSQESPVKPETDNHWRITGIDLSTEDARREELIGYINDGLLDPPNGKSYNLADYESLVQLAEENRKSR